MAKQITIDELEKYLWGAAVDLRGQIDAAAYKDYIFPLVFFKRISDVRDEEFEKFEAEGGKEYAELMMAESTIKIPAGAHWQDVFNTTENIGQKLVDVFRMIEHANPAKDIDGRLVGGLEGIFGDKTIWTNKNKMPDNIIRSLLNNFNKLTLSLAACPADEMGTGYEYLIGQFADDAGNTAQEFYTNRTVVSLMDEILNIKPHDSIYDPTCGSGGMLIKSLTHLKESGAEWRDVQVYGQEINAGTSAIARMNLYLHGIHDFSIVNADTLENPAFIKDGKVQYFNVVLANPPYSICTWNREKFEHDKYGRCFLGVPPQARADYAFIQHILASMNPDDGRCAILLPHGVLNRKEEREIRQNHILCDNIDAIIGLGRNLFFNSGLESFILICRNNKREERKGKILFIEAEKCTHREGKQSYLFPDDIAKIVHAYNNLCDEPGFSKWVDNEDIVDGNLNIKSYVKGLADENSTSTTEFINDYFAAQRKLHDEITQLDACNGIDNPTIECHIKNREIDTTAWHRVKLGEVAYERSGRIDNPSESQYDFYIGSDCISQYDFTINKKSPAATVTSAQKEFHKGDYLLVRRSLYGSDFRERAPRADFEGCCSADILTIRENNQFIYDGYLIFVLYSKPIWDFIVSNSTGGLTRRIKWKQLADFEFLLPPMAVQKELTEKLWAAYELKQSYIKMIAATDEMVKSQFIEMFGNPLSVEQNYPIKTLGDCCNLNPRKPNITLSDTEKVSFVPMTSVSEDGYLMAVAEEEYGKVKKGFTYFENNDVLFAKITPCMENGKGAIAHSLTNGVGMGSTEFHVLRPIEGISNPYWILALTRLPLFRADATKNMKGTGGQKRVGAEYLNDFKIGLPPIEKQIEFEQIYKQADKSKFSDIKSKCKYKHQS